MINNEKLREVFDKTNGHCHFCGDAVDFQKYGLRDIGIDGAWEADHVIQRGKGGTKDISNCFPACTKCNRLRWHRTGENLREMITLGIIANDEIKKKSELGKKINELKQKRFEQNIKRRRRDIMA